MKKAVLLAMTLSMFATQVQADLAEPSSVWGEMSPREGVRTELSDKTWVDAHGTCRTVDAPLPSGASSMFISTRTAAEWQSLVNNPPPGSELVGCCNPSAFEPVTLCQEADNPTAVQATKYATAGDGEAVTVTCRREIYDGTTQTWEEAVNWSCNGPTILTGEAPPRPEPPAPPPEVITVQAYGFVKVQNLPTIGGYNLRYTRGVYPNETWPLYLGEMQCRRKHIRASGASDTTISLLYQSAVTSAPQQTGYQRWPADGRHGSQSINYYRADNTVSNFNFPQDWFDRVYARQGWCSLIEQFPHDAAGRLNESQMGCVTGYGHYDTTAAWYNQEAVVGRFINPAFKNGVNFPLYGISTYKLYSAYISPSYRPTDVGEIADDYIWYYDDCTLNSLVH